MPNDLGLIRKEHLQSGDARKLGTATAEQFLRMRALAVTDEIPADTSGGGGAGITALIGDVTAGPGTGTQVATITNDAVTYAKMQNVSTDSVLIGRGDTTSGDPQEITLGAGLTMTGTTLSASGGGPAPPDGAVQYNDADAFGGKETFRFLKDHDSLVVGGEGSSITATDFASCFVFGANCHIADP